MDRRQERGLASDPALGYEKRSVRIDRPSLATEWQEAATIEEARSRRSHSTPGFKTPDLLPAADATLCAGAARNAVCGGAR